MTENNIKRIRENPYKYFEDYQDSKFEARKWCGNKAC
jgi:hypothetical protein